MILQKRPLLHPPIPNSRSKRTQQVIYVSAKTPFISAVKRVRKMLALQEGAFTGGLDEVSAEQGRRVQGFRQQQQQRRESVVLKATGRAIERCMSLGAYFLKDSSVKVTIGTGSLDVVDDIVRN
ncbi:Rpp20 subunit of nuclear RNase MRP and P-domain-containing protein, partial [Peziza echinospora]